MWAPRDLFGSYFSLVRSRPRHVQKIIVDKSEDCGLLHCRGGEEGLQLSYIQPNIVINFKRNIYSLESDLQDHLLLCVKCSGSLTSSLPTSSWNCFSLKIETFTNRGEKGDTNGWGWGRSPVKYFEECLHMLLVPISTLHFSWDSCEGRHGIWPTGFYSSPWSSKISV